MKLKGKLLTAFIVPLLLLSGMIAYTINNHITDMIIENTLYSNSRLGYRLLDERYPGDWELKQGIMYKGGERVEGDTDFVDMFQEETNSFAAIFKEHIRVITNEVKENGSRASGVSASDEIEEIVINNGEEYTGIEEIMGTRCYVRYIPLKQTDGTVIGMWFVGIEEAVVLKEVQTILMAIMLPIILVILFSIFFVFLLTRSILKHFKKITDAYVLVEAGDLSIDCEVKTKDEIKQVADGFNGMIAHMRGIISEVKSSSAEVAHGSEQLATATDQSSKAMEEVANAIGEIAAGSQNNAAKVEEMYSNVEGMTHSAEHIAQESQKAVLESNAVFEAAKKGGQRVEAVVKVMKEVDQSSRQVKAIVSELEQTSHEIGNIIRLITDIAEQTNLLALNAAIEAARAGESGKGFAVVAEEVRKLAEGASRSADSVSNLVQHIQDKTQQVVISTDQINVLIDQGVETSVETDEDIKKIVHSINQVAEGIQGIAQSALSQTQTVSVIKEAIGYISAATEGASEHTQHVSAAVEEQVSTLEEIGSTSAMLLSMANELEKSVSHFKI